MKKLIYVDYEQLVFMLAGLVLLNLIFIAGVGRIPFPFFVLMFLGIHIVFSLTYLLLVTIPNQRSILVNLLQATLGIPIGLALPVAIELVRVGMSGGLAK